ncbi:MAG: CoA-binding protein [Candidatus Bathyarchaeia archaeon]|nr:CoA-binding protein [Candidatus Bathyarchaeia archaeon]
MLNSEGLRKILSQYRNVAVVGLSRDPSKDSYRVAKYLKEQGFHIIPVNPTVEEILGEKSYKSLLDMPEKIQKTLEIVDVFRPSDEVLPITEQAIQLRKPHGMPHVVWMQLGIINEEAAEKAREAGLIVIMDKCMMREHKRFFGKE